MNEQQYCHLPMFSRWRCLTHDAGSYNFNWLLKHEIEGVCELVTDYTVGVVRPKTYGTADGNIGKDQFPEWHQKVKLKQSHKAIKEKWETFLVKERREIQIHRSGGKIANKIRKIFQN